MSILASEFYNDARTVEILPCADLKTSGGILCYIFIEARKQDTEFRYNNNVEIGI